MNAIAIPVGESPTGTGVSPVPPIFRAGSTAVATGRLLLLIAILSVNYFAARADELVRSFAIKEFFGVAHPNQMDCKDHVHLAGAV